MIGKFSWVRHHVTGHRGRVTAVYSQYPYLDAAITNEHGVDGDPRRFINSRWVEWYDDDDATWRMVPVDLLEETEPFRSSRMDIHNDRGSWV